MTVIAVSLGGEGEPVAGADLVVNANLFRPELMVRPRFAAELRPGQLALATSAGLLAIRNKSVDLIIARRFPIQFDRTVDDLRVETVAVEAFRVAKPGAAIDLGCSSCDLDSLAVAIRSAGFIDVSINLHRYAVEGRKP